MIRFKYKLKKLPKRKLILWASIMLVFSLSLGSIVRYYAANVDKPLYESSISGDTVFINDYDTDWFYYEGLNYTEVGSDQKLPEQFKKEAGTKSGTFTKKYDESNLVLVELNYSGEDINGVAGTGYVSSAEPQSKYRYTKWYPVENGYITIELIDNPWTKRPEGYGFNGWACTPDIYDETNDNWTITNTKNCDEYTFEYDNQYYTRYLKIPAPTGTDKSLVISLKTSWIKADIIDDINNITDFNAKGMQPLSNIVSSSELANYTNLNGFFYQTTISSDRNLYYDATGTNCTESTANCSGTVYKLIQPSDTELIYKEGDTAGTGISASDAYYLVTRDTNLFEVKNDSLTLDQFEVSRPFTITSSHTDTGVMHEITQVTIHTQADLNIENVKLVGGSPVVRMYGQTAHHVDGIYKTLFANYNTKIGRNVAREYNNSNIDLYTLDSVVGMENVKVIVESGIYNELIVLPTDNRRTDIENYAIYGSDYDRVTKNNENLLIQYQAASSIFHDHDNQNNKPTSTMTVKSGTYGNTTMDNTLSEIFYQFGIYAGSNWGSSNESTESLRILKVEGGKIVNINGGPFVKRDFDDVTVAIYMTGGEVETLVGGAGVLRTYGSRVVSVTSGKVNNAVVGGSNSFYAEGTAGPLSGDTLVYIGGKATIGGDSMITTNPTNLFGVEKKGSVFGAGLGREDNDTTGIVNNSNVIINGGTINGDVYAGGNYGSTGDKIDRAHSEILIKSGNIIGNVFGGSNKRGFGNQYKDSAGNINIGNIYVTTIGGNIGNIYGGSNTSGLVNGNITINLKGGTINNVYGGGFGENTFVNGNVNVYTNTESNSNLIVNQNVYGASANGTINTTGQDIPETTGNNIDFSTKQLYIKSPITITVSTRYRLLGTLSATIIHEDDGSEEVVTWTPTNGHIIENNGGYFIYNSSTNGNGTCSSRKCSIYIPVEFGITPNLDEQDYYEPKKSGSTITGMEKITTEKAKNPNYGENEVIIGGGTINGAVFGGGYGNIAEPVIAGNIKVVVNSGIINEVFAGNDLQGEINKSKADFYVRVNGGTIGSVYGAGRMAGATETTVRIKDGVIGNVYGGGQGDTTKQEQSLAAVNTSDVIITGGTIENAFGGGGYANVTDGYIKILGGELTNVFGGSNMSGTVSNFHAEIRNGKVTNAFGGNNAGGEAGKGVLDIEATSTCSYDFGDYHYSPANCVVDLENAFGGSKGSGAISRDTHMRVVNVTFTGNIYGGGYEAPTTGNTKIYLQNVSVPTPVERTVTKETGNVFGGGDHSYVLGETTVNLIDNVTVNNVYGGGHYGFVGDTCAREDSNDYREGYHIVEGFNDCQPRTEVSMPITTNVTNVNILNARINENVYGSGNASFVYGITNVNIGDKALMEIEKQVKATYTGDESYRSYESNFLTGFNTHKKDYEITIVGSVYGGSETNATETEIFSESTIGVVGASNVNISSRPYYIENEYDLTEEELKSATKISSSPTLNIRRSIYGGGNNSIVEGNSKVLINKLGTEADPLTILSIQRADDVYIVDSYLYIIGMQDRKFATLTPYTLIRLGKLYLLGETDVATSKGSVLYLKKSTTFLQEYFSGEAKVNVKTTSISEFTEEAVNETPNGIVPASNIDNQIYMKENFPSVVTFAVTNDIEPTFDTETTKSGEIHGMTYFGVFQIPSTFDDYSFTKASANTGHYNHTYTNTTTYNDKDITLDEAYAYAYGRHSTYQNINMTDYEYQRTHNGFYSNFIDENEETGINKVKVNYIDQTPSNTLFYRWDIGKSVLVIEVNMEANKFSQRTAVNANIDMMDILEEYQTSQGETKMGYWKDAYLEINGLDLKNFKADFGDDKSFKGVLADRSDIPLVNTSYDIHDTGEEFIDANNKFALVMGTSESGWLSNYQTEFFSEGYAPESGSKKFSGNNNSYRGDNVYVFDSSRNIRQLSFWLYYSQNLDLRYAVKKQEEDDVKSISMNHVFISANLYRSTENQMRGAAPLDVLIDVRIELSESESDNYGTIMSPGKKYDIFQNKTVSIATNGTFSIYNKLALDFSNNTGKKIGLDPPITSINDLYNSKIIKRTVTVSGVPQYQYWKKPERVLETNYNFPVGTRISMIDLNKNEEYYYEVTTDNHPTFVNEADNPTEDSRIYRIKLEDFTKMACTNDCNEYYSDDMNGENSKYYLDSASMAIEEYIFIVDMSGLPEDKTAEEKEYYMYLKMIREVAVDTVNPVDENFVPDDLNSNYETDSFVQGLEFKERVVVAPRGIPTTDYKFRLNQNVDTELQVEGYLDQTSIYTDEENLLLVLDTNLLSEKMVQLSDTLTIPKYNTKYDDYRIGAIITLDKNNDGNYENYADDLSGLIVDYKGVKYSPYTDQKFRIPLASRTSNVLSKLYFDFSKSDIQYGEYRMNIEVFLSYDGIYYEDNQNIPKETLTLYFTLMDSKYGLEITAPPESINHDVKNGKDEEGSREIEYTIKEKNGLANPSLKLGLQRRLYPEKEDDNDNAYYSKNYENVDIRNLVEKIELFEGDNTSPLITYNLTTDGNDELLNLNTYLGNYKKDDLETICEENSSLDCSHIYHLSNISPSVRSGSDGMVETTYRLKITLKDGPEAGVSPTDSPWKSGTYRFVISLFDEGRESKPAPNTDEYYILNSKQIGEDYEYLVIRDLKVKNNEEGSGS